MAEIDAETIERVARWCAEAGRQASAAEIRRALAPLSWDELLLAKALLADPPPARPLGPSALADIARGAPPDVAAERERGGRYVREDAAPAADAAPASAAPSPRRRTAPRRAGGEDRPTLVIRRARDRAPAASSAPPPLPPVDELRRPEGRPLLERLFRRVGGRRAALAAELAKGWRTGEGGPPGEGDVESLLEHHGLSRAFERRERDEILHAIRASGGVRSAAAVRLGLDPDALDAAISRVGAVEAVERIRGERRADLRGRATLAERVRLLLTDEPRLRDLGLLPEWEEDLRARLPEHVRALRSGRTALSASLGVTPEAAAALAERFGLPPGEPPAKQDRTQPAPRRHSGRAAPGVRRTAGARRAGARPRSAPRPARGRGRPARRR